MNSIKVIAIFDVGKTNKKLLLFDEEYKVVFEESQQLEEITDEDGFACENIDALTGWIRDSFKILLTKRNFDIKAVNFSAYGASFVYLDQQLKVIPPLYNYLKPFPSDLKSNFYEKYGGENSLALQTASPVLGNLNSGMQLYRLAKEQPGKFETIKWALHLPQYVSFVISSFICSDITSIGCHTNLWNFQLNAYHQWVSEEGLLTKFPKLQDCTKTGGSLPAGIPVGIGLHDSSAALIPYQSSFVEPFVLLSTGTWCISLNPFNHTPLTIDELNKDCLCYLSWDGKPVKAARLFAGYEHEEQLKRLAKHFDKPLDYFKSVEFDNRILNKLKPSEKREVNTTRKSMMGKSVFEERTFADFLNFEEAYHQLIYDIIDQQVKSTNLVVKGVAVKKIFVDGGFSKNTIFMQLLANAFTGMEVYAASVSQASALGAALAIHQHWNINKIPANLIALKLYRGSRPVAIKR